MAKGMPPKTMTRLIAMEAPIIISTTEVVRAFNEAGGEVSYGELTIPDQRQRQRVEHRRRGLCRDRQRLIKAHEQQENG